MSGPRAALALSVALVLVAAVPHARAGAASSAAIYEIRVDGSARRLVGGVGALGFALSREGARVAFFRADREKASLWLVNRNGSGERQLAGADAAGPILVDSPLVWSPDGEALAYTALDPRCAPDLCLDTRAVVVDSRDGHVRETFDGEALRWSRDGRRMVWACDSQGGGDPYGEREALCFTLSEGGDVQQVEVGLADRPAFAPDGNRVAFTGHGGESLRLLDLRTRSTRLLANPPQAVDGALSWSPDGRRIAFATAANELFTVAAGARPRRVGRFRDARSPAWGPGGRRIAFLRGRLWTVRPDGSAARPVTRERISAAACSVDSFSAPSCGPAWSPDGRKLYYLGSG
jgi:Tol biopolymer transport system component